MGLLLVHAVIGDVMFNHGRDGMVEHLEGAAEARFGGGDEPGILNEGCARRPLWNRCLEAAGPGAKEYAGQGCREGHAVHVETARR